MSRRMTTLGLAAICALALSAVSAPSASAATTAFTCVSGGMAGPTNFSDADCSVPNAGGGFGHTAIPANTSTTLTLKKLTNWEIVGELFAATTELKATGIECVGCAVENKEVNGVMQVTGSGKLKFTGVTVVAPPNCTVVGSAAGEITTKELKFTTTSSAEIVLEPNVVGGPLATFDIPGPVCVVSGSGFQLTGKIKATLSGAKLNVNVTKASKELKLEGVRASLKGEGTLEAGVGAVHSPLALT